MRGDMSEPMTYGEPTAPHLKVMSRPVDIFIFDEVPDPCVKPHQDYLQDPISMRRQATKAKMLSLLLEPSTLDLEADVDLLKAFTDLTIAGSNDTETYKALERVIHQSTPLILKEKYRHNYPRPAQVVNKYIGDFEPNIDSKSALTPSYPSGHSAQAYLLALIFSEAHPHHATHFHKTAEAIGMGRVFAGLHTKEDHDYGQEIGALLYQAMRPEFLSYVVSLVGALKAGTFLKIN